MIAKTLIVRGQEMAHIRDRLIECAPYPGEEHRKPSTFKLAEMFPNARDADPGLFPTADIAQAYLENARWPNGIVCPCLNDGEECRSQRITIRKGGFYRCNRCHQDFTVRTGTIFERSHVPLHKWIYMIHQVLTKDSKIVSVDLAKELEVTQTTAWKMLSRVRGICDVNDIRMLKTVMCRNQFVRLYPTRKARRFRAEKKEQFRNSISPMIAACRLLREKTGIDVEHLVRGGDADREDAVQEIWMTVLEKDLGLQIDAEQIRDAVKKSKIGALDRWKHISLYAPIRGTDNLRLIDTLQAEAG